MSERIIVVSGFPRSGTSLMMQMLRAGGIPILSDINLRDQFNPGGYCEYEPALQLSKPSEASVWLSEAVNKAVKIFAYQLECLPNEFDYQIIFMQRKIAEMLASGKNMAAKKHGPIDRQIARERIFSLKVSYVLYEREIMTRKNWSGIFISYNGLLENPLIEVQKIAGFLSKPLDIEAMISVINPDLNHYA
jgi:hypothetical protein